MGNTSEGKEDEAERNAEEKSTHGKRHERGDAGSGV